MLRRQSSATRLSRRRRSICRRLFLARCALPMDVANAVSQAAVRSCASNSGNAALFDWLDVARACATLGGSQRSRLCFQCARAITLRVSFLLSVLAPCGYLHAWRRSRQRDAGTHSFVSRAWALALRRVRGRGHCNFLRPSCGRGRLSFGDFLVTLQQVCCRRALLALVVFALFGGVSGALLRCLPQTLCPSG